MSFINPGKTNRFARSFVLGRRRFRVTASLVVANLLSGGEVRVYKNGLLPGDTHPDHVEHLLAEGLIRPLEEHQ